MTTPEDTTRLRADAEAVRAAGIRQRMTHDAWKATLYAVVTEDVLDLAMEYREAPERFRKAKAALYADAFPEDVILALLDEVERLRAMINEAGDGTFNVVALLDLYHKRATEADEKHLDALRREKSALDEAARLELVIAEKVAETIRLGNALAEECE